MIYRSPDFHSKWTSVFNIHVFSNRSGLYLLPFYVEYWSVGQTSVEIYFNMWPKCCLTLTPLKVICWHSGGCWEANVRKSHVWASLQSQELSLVLRGRQLYECFPEQTWSPLHFVSFLQRILSTQPASGCQYKVYKHQAVNQRNTDSHSHPFLFRPQCYTQAVYGVSARRHTDTLMRW